MIEVKSRPYDELTVEEAQTLYAMGYEIECNNGHVTGVSREVDA